MPVFTPYTSRPSASAATASARCRRTAASNSGTMLTPGPGGHRTDQPEICVAAEGDLTGGRHER